MNPPNPMNPTPRSNVSNQWTPGEIEAFKLGISEAGDACGMTYDDDTESPRSIAYDMGRNLGEMDGENKFKRAFALAPEMAEALADAADELETVCKRVDFEVESAGGSEMLAAWLNDGKKTLSQARAILARINGEGGGV